MATILDSVKRERAFAEEYVKAFDQEAAARVISWTGPATEFLERPTVQAHIEKLLADRSAAAEITADTILIELKSVAKDAKENKKFAEAVSALRSMAEMIGALSKNPGGRPLKPGEGATVQVNVLNQRTATDDAAYGEVKVNGAVIKQA